VEFIAGAIRSAQLQPIQLQDTFEVGEQHLDLFCLYRAPDRVHLHGLIAEHCAPGIRVTTRFKRAGVAVTCVQDHGGCFLGRGAFLESPRLGNYLAAARGPNLWIDGSSIPIVWDEPMPGVGRPWFECPACGRRARHMYLRDPIACKRCHGLRHASQYLGQQTPGVHRIARWRRQLGLDTRPFGSIPTRPAHHVRFHRIVERIRAEEARLVGHLQTVTRDLERRIDLRKARGEW